jgi:branched-chain amino acid transport system substrate-binding protein
MISQRHMIKTRSLVLVLSALLLVGLAVPLALASPDRQDANVLRIGYLGAATSPAANGARLAMDQIDAAGGVPAPDGTTYRFELVPLAVAPEADTLASGIEKLVRQNVVAILGPDDSALFTAENIQALLDTQLPILTPATVDSLTDNDATDSIFRIRAPERVYSYALATYLTQDLGLQSIALVQTDVESTEALLSFEATLGTLGLNPADKIQTPGGDALDEPASRLLQANPEAVVMWGRAEDAANLLRQLRDGGWGGQFAYRYAEEAARAGVLPDSLAEGVLGVNSWSYAYPGRATRIFLLDYVLAFGEVPTPLSVAAYDAVWYARAVIGTAGIEPAALREGLIGATPRTLVQGTLHPIEFANGDLARLAMVYQLGPYGAPTALAYFDDTQRLNMEDAGQPVAQVPTNTPPPGTPTLTPFPTATLEGTWVRVTVNALNVRSGPGFNYDKIGQVDLGDLLRVLGTVPDYTWMLVDFAGGVGWVKTEYTEVSGDLASVAFPPIPPTPTPAATLTPSLPPSPDIVIDSVVLNPAQPVPNQQFTATVMVRNAGGGAAGTFAVAATFQPGDVYLATHVEGLAGGQSGQAVLTGVLTGTGAYQIGVVADLNKEVQELNEDNNVFNISYRADYPVFVENTGIQINAETGWDLYGGTNDFRWDGYNIAMRNGSQIGVLAGYTYETAHYDILTPGVVNNTTGLTTEQVNPGAVYGFYTAEGRRAVMRVDNRQGQTIWISYRVYNNDV